MKDRNQRRALQGEIISTKMEKTAVVKVTRKKRHPRYQKLVETWKKYYAHLDTEGFQEGDIVTIVETRPLSKTKRWRVAHKSGPSAKVETT